MPASPRFFASPAAFRDWLQQHACTQAELVVGYWKVGSGRPSMTWSESVDEALCFGWIDGVRKRIDDDAYLIRFTPRKPGSIWSEVNVAKVAQLSAAGRMTPAGLDAFAARIERKMAVYAYERRDHPELTAEERAAFQADAAAWAFFESCPPSYRKPILYWVVSARKPETRARRLAQLVAACARGQRLLK